MTDVAISDGLDQIRADLAAGRRPPIFEALGLSLVMADRGFTALEGIPDERFFNLCGSVYGGYVATLLDSACSSAVQTRITAEQTYTTLDLKITFIRALSKRSGLVRAEGRVVSFGERAVFAEGRLTDCRGQLCATATSTLLIVERCT